MSKKIVLGVVLLGLIGILVAGAVIRTLDKTGNEAEARGLGHGAGGQQELQAGAGQGQGVGRGGAGSGQGSGVSQAEVDEWLTVQGSVAVVDENALVVRTADGREIVVENRPWWFAQEQGFSAQAGDQLTLVAFDEGGELKVGQITNLTTGQEVAIRDRDGRPMWAGRGRSGG